MSYSNIKVLQLSNYVKPEIKEKMGHDWVLNGKNNAYFKYVIDRYNGSATNSAIINSFVERIFGRGLTAFDGSEEDMTYLDSLISKKELKKIVYDYRLQGNAAIQVIRGKGSNEVVKLYHMPVETLAPRKVNDEGEIDTYFYCQDWKNPHNHTPEPIPAFKAGARDKKSILYIKKYRAGQYYFATPEYQAALQYAELEEEIANFSINHIKNGLSLGQIINFNNGVPDEEVQDKIESQINSKLKGSGGARFLVSFNDNKENATEIQNITKDDASAEWHFWVNEARQQIITGHRVVSPMLFGIKDATGLGNNANEMEVANELMEETVIRPDQEVILDALDEILTENGKQYDLGFLPLRTMEEEETVETETEADKVEVEEKEDEEVALAQKKKELPQEVATGLIDLGEDIDLSEWDLIDEQEVNYEEEEKLSLRTSPKSAGVKTGTARPNAKSAQDGEDYIVRYKYVGNPTPQREFCKKMMQANKVYRKEDIIQMGNKVVNKGWGAYGADKYSIWLYKGGGNCHHKWNRVIYLKKGASVDPNSPLAETISTTKARSKGYRIPTNENEVSIAPKNLPNNGFIQ